MMPLVQTHRWGLWKKMVDTDILPKDASSWRLFSFTHLKLSMLVKNWVNERFPPLKKIVVPKLQKFIFQHLTSCLFSFIPLTSRPFHRSTFPFEKKSMKKFDSASLPSGECHETINTSQQKRGWEIPEVTFD